MSKLAGKTAVITGGNSGMGLATANLFAKEGANVVITGRRKEEVDKAVADSGGKLTGFVGDVANLADLDALYALVKQKFGALDIVFANAGIGEFAPLGQITEAHFDKHFNINVKGLLFTVQKALPLLRDGGSIILNSSIVNAKGMDAFSVYAATKAAVRSFARGWTVDLKARKIRVNSLSPGPINTPIFGKMGLTQEQLEAFGSHMTGQIPLGRIGEPNDIAKAVLFLASDDSAFITGIDLAVDGGMAQI